MIKFSTLTSFTVFADYSCHIIYQGKDFRLPRTRIKSIKMQAVKVKNSKIVKLHVILPQTTQL